MKQERGWREGGRKWERQRERQRGVGGENIDEMKIESQKEMFASGAEVSAEVIALT